MKTIWMSVLLILAAALGGCSEPAPETLMANARQAIEQDNREAANVDLKNILKQQPESAEARLLLGENALAMGDPATAENQLRRALEYGAAPAEVQPLLAKALRGLGKRDALIEEIHPEVADSADVKAQLYAARGEALLAMERLEEASAAIDDALAADEQSVPALVARARLALARAEDDKAAEWLERAAKIAPNHAQVRVTEAALALRRGQPKVAITALKDAIDSPGEEILPAERFRARLQLSDALLRQGRLDEADSLISRMLERDDGHPAVNYLAAALAYEREQYQEAESRLQKVLTRAPDNLRAKTLLGAVKMQQGQNAQAQRYLSEALAANPDNAQVRLMLARVLRQSGQEERVSQLLEEGIRRAEGDSQVLAALGNAAASSGALSGILSGLAQRDDEGVQRLRVSLGEALIQGGRSDDAMAVLSETRGEDEADELRRRRLMIMAAVRSGDNERALSEAESLVSERPDDATVRNLAGGVYMAAERYDDARRQFRKALELNPDNAAADLNLGLLALAQGNAQEAVTALQRGLKKSPDNVRAMLAMARARNATGEYDQAVQWLEKARSAAANAIQPRLILARYYIGQGETGKARKIAEEAVEAAPGRADALALRGVAELSDGAAETAVETLQEAREAAPESPGIGLALARAQLSAEQPEQAVVTLEQVREQRGDLLAAGYLLGVAQYQAGQREAALGTAAALREQEGGEALGSLLRGELRLRMEEPRAAAEAFARAAEAGSRQAAIRAVAAGAQAGLDKPAAPLKRWVETHQDDREARLQLADWYASNEQYPESIAQYEALLDVGGANSPGVLNNLAWAYQQAGDERALETARKALSLAPGAPAVLDTLGWIETLNGNAERGAELLAKAVERASGAAPLHYHYAEALERLGRKDEALKQVERALETEEFAERDAAEALQARLQGDQPDSRSADADTGMSE